MKRIVLLPLVLLASLIPLGAAEAAPAGPETNPIGTLTWLPPNSRESSQVAAGSKRLVVIYDRSLDNTESRPTTLMAKGAFGLKIASSSHGLRMVGHSPGVSSLTGGGLLNPADKVLVGLQGDVRDGACSKVGTASFSSAFSTTRSFVHWGSTPYQPLSGPGACEVVNSSTPTGGGFKTVVTTHVPGFWIDVQLPSATVKNELWYVAAYDTQGQSGKFYATSDAAGQSRSVGDPQANWGGQATS